MNWYLGEIEGDIDSVEMLAEKKVLVEKVIERLVRHVSHVFLNRFNQLYMDHTNVSLASCFHTGPCSVAVGYGGRGR